MTITKKTTLIGSRLLRHRVSVLTLFLYAFPVLATYQANAQSTTYGVSAGFTGGYCGGTGQVIYTPGTVSTSGPGDCLGTGAASATFAAGNPNSYGATSSITAPVGSAELAGANAHFNGSVYVNAGGSQTTIPLIFTVSGEVTTSFSADTGYGSTASAGFAATDANGQVLVSGGASNGPFSIDQTIMVTPNELLYLGGVANTLVYISGSATATVDPLIQIDPTYLASNPGDSLVFSLGYLQTTPVPLPPSGILTLVGIVALGASARRGHRARHSIA